MNKNGIIIISQDEVKTDEFHNEAFKSLTNLDPDPNENLEKEEDWLEKKVFKIVPTD